MLKKRASSRGITEWEDRSFSQREGIGNGRNHNFRASRKPLEPSVTWILCEKVITLANDTLADHESGH
jgi:hypothetical protein